MQLKSWSSKLDDVSPEAWKVVPCKVSYKEVFLNSRLPSQIDRVACNEVFSGIKTAISLRQLMEISIEKVKVQRVVTS
jgi:hypothetical protein